MTTNYKLYMITQKDMLELVKINKDIRDFAILHREKYLSTLSEKFIDMPIETVILNDKKYFLTLDTSARLYYILCMKQNKTIGMCKFIQFSNKIKDIDFFFPLIDRYDLSKSFYIFGVYVDETERGHGACKLMLKYIMDYASKLHISLIISDIKKSNIPSINCNMSAGFINTKILSRKPDVHFYVYPYNYLS